MRATGTESCEDMTDRAAFLFSRTQGLGGSDMGSLLSQVLPVEYGCQRNLWARLSGIPEDEAGAETEPMLLGTLCEPFIRRAYSDKMGRRVEVFGLKKHDTVTALQYHDDGIIYPAIDDKRTTPGTLEVKALGRQMMYKVNETGLPLDYVIQLQNGLSTHKHEWGAFAVSVREDILPVIALELAAQVASDPMPKLPRRIKIIQFEVERDEEIIGAIETEAPRFWATIGNESKSPPRLEPDDPRCGRCPRKVWCQGKALMDSVEPEHGIVRRPDLAALVEEYRTNIAILNECKELVGETEKKFKEALGSVPAVKVPVPSESGIEWKNVIYRLRGGANRVDGRAMAITYDQIRRAAIEAKLPGADLTPPSSEFEKVGAPSRPLLLSSLLPKKPKKKGEVPEVDSPEESTE
jgi:hypothetical protein